MNYLPLCQLTEATQLVPNPGLPMISHQRLPTDTSSRITIVGQNNCYSEKPHDSVIIAVKPAELLSTSRRILKTTVFLSLLTLIVIVDVELVSAAMRLSFTRDMALNAFYLISLPRPL